MPESASALVIEPYHFSFQSDPSAPNSSTGLHRNFPGPEERVLQALLRDLESSEKMFDMVDDLVGEEPDSGDHVVPLSPRYFPGTPTNSPVSLSPRTTEDGLPTGGYRLWRTHG